MASKKSALKIVESAVRNKVLPEDALDLRAIMYKYDGTFHSSPTCNYGRDRSRNPFASSKPSSTPTEVTFEEFSAFTEANGGPCYCVAYGDHGFPGLRHALEIADAHDVARLALRVKPGKLAPGSAARKLNQIASAESTLGFQKSPTYLEARESVLAELKKARLHLQQVNRDPLARERILREVQASLRGRYRVSFDEAQVIVGLVGSYFPKTLEELRQAFSVREDKNITVLLMPRYLYDYFQRELYRTNSQPNLLTAYPSTFDEATLETAAVLWTPHDPKSPCADLAAALEAAQALEDE